MFYQIVLSPEVKRCAVITYKQGIHKMPHELPNDLKYTKLEKFRKVSRLHRIIA